MVAKSREEFAIKNDSITNYETVKVHLFLPSHLTLQYFNAEDYEFGRYREAVKTYQDAEKKTLGTFSLSSFANGSHIEPYEYHSRVHFHPRITRFMFTIRLPRFHRPFNSR